MSGAIKSVAKVFSPIASLFGAGPKKPKLNPASTQSSGLKAYDPTKNPAATPLARNPGIVGGPGAEEMLKQWDVASAKLAKLEKEKNRGGKPIDRPGNNPVWMKRQYNPAKALVQSLETKLLSNLWLAPPPTPAPAPAAAPKPAAQAPAPAPAPLGTLGTNAPKPAAQAPAPAAAPAVAAPPAVPQSPAAPAAVAPPPAQVGSLGLGAGPGQAVAPVAPGNAPVSEMAGNIVGTQQQGTLGTEAQARGGGPRKGRRGRINTLLSSFGDATEQFGG